MVGWVPPDNVAYRMRYEPEGGGVCGPAAIAADLGLTVRDVLEKWCGEDSASFRGFSPVDELKETLEAFGYKVKWFGAKKALQFPKLETTAILRVQWLRPDGSEYYWAARGQHSHYLLMKKHQGTRWAYCNIEGWFSEQMELWQTYLWKKHGYISSILELR